MDDVAEHGDIAGIDSGAALTGMCWVNLDAIVDRDGVLNKGLLGSTTSFYMRVAVTTNAIRVAFGGAQTPGGLTGNILTTGVWAHWAFVYDGGGVANADRLKIYFNGTDQSLTFAGTIPATMNDSGTGLVRVGRDSEEQNTVDGKIALVKVWTAVLTAAEVFQELNSYRPTRTANLVLWSPYDDGTSARDYSGAGNHGTVTGALQFEGPPVGFGSPILVG